MRVIGLDLGSKTVGVAVSDFLGIIANPIGTLRIEENDLNQALELVKNVVKEQNAEKIVSNSNFSNPKKKKMLRKNKALHYL